MKLLATIGPTPLAEAVALAGVLYCAGLGVVPGSRSTEPRAAAPVIAPRGTASLVPIEQLVPAWRMRHDGHDWSASEGGARSTYAGRTGVASADSSGVTVGWTPFRISSATPPWHIDRLPDLQLRRIEVGNGRVMVAGGISERVRCVEARDGYCTEFSTYVAAFDRATGFPLWERTLRGGTDVASSARHVLILGLSTELASYGNTITVVDGESGVLRTAEAPATLRSARSIVIGDTGYVAASLDDHDGIVFAIDLTTLRVRWRIRGFIGEFPRLAAAGGALWTSSEAGVVRAYDLASGSERWHWSFGEPAVVTGSDAHVTVVTQSEWIGLAPGPSTGLVLDRGARPKAVVARATR